MILDTPTPKTSLSSSLLLEDKMSVLRSKFLFVSVASVTVLALIQSPSAQNSGTAGGTGKNLPPAAVSATADQKAAAAMSSQPTSAPTDADRKAAAVMAAPDPAK
jgi:hypothetical protein